MGKELEQTLLQERHTEGPETYEKMLSITSHQRHVTKITMRYHFTLFRMASLIKQTTSAGEDVEKREP